MTLINRKICLNRIKVDPFLHSQNISILISTKSCVLHKSFKQKVKNNSANFFGESVEIEIENEDLIFQAVECSQNSKQNILTSFIISLSNIQPRSKQNFTTQSRGFSLNWTCEGAESKDNESSWQQCTTYEISQIRHELYSQQMLNKKYTKCYSITNQNQGQLDIFSGTYSQIRY